MEKKKKFIQKTGRRKTGTARVRLLKGSGEIIINDRKPQEYFSDIQGAEAYLREPLVLVGKEGKFDFSIKTNGGGKQSQLEASRLGIARAIVENDETTKTTLKKARFLTRDSRMKERKKYGLKRARKAPQYRKR